MKSSYRFVLLLLSSVFTLSLVGQLAPQDHWTYLAPDSDPPSGTAFTGPVAASETEVFVGLDNGLVGVFSASDGSFLRTVGSFSRINGMAIDSEGHLWVLNLSAPKLHEIDPATGTELSSFGTGGTGEGEITQQSTNTRLLLGIDGSDQLHVADPAGYRVIVFAADGSFVRQFGESGNLIGQFSSSPRAIAVSQSGTVFLSAGRLYQFTAMGVYINHQNNNTNNLFLTNDELPLSYSTLYSYDLLKTVNINAGGSSSGLAFQPDGTLWRLYNGRLQQWRRYYAGSDSPAPGITAKVPPQPRIIRSGQRQGSTLMDIEFEILDPDSAEVEVRVLAWRDGENTLDKLVIPQTWVEETGVNKGPGIATNTVHRLTWDVAADFTEPFGYFEVEILAVDDQPLLPVHWITLPATEDMESVTISRSPLTEAQLLQYLLWESAAAEGSCVISGEAIYRKMDGEPLYLANTFNWWALNDYLNAFGMSWATTEERNRLDSGRFGQLSVSDYSVVREVRSFGGSVIADEMVSVAGGTLTAESEIGPQEVAEFEIGKFEVTYAQWRKVRDWGLGNGYTDLPQGYFWNELGAPIAGVSWYDVLKWCNAKSEMEGLTLVYTVNGEVYRVDQMVPDQDLTANGYRLPTEAEWEFAARGGTLSEGYEYSGSDDIDAVAWYGGNNSPNGAKPVGTKLANELGIHDMSGNVYEWCWDSWSATSSDRVRRGGRWNGYADYCRVASRYSFGPSSRSYYVGFRLARRQSPQ